MKRKFRLIHSSDFKRVRRFGKSYAHPLIVLLVLPNEQTTSRIGVVAGRSIGGAVQRNRAKRRLRAAVAPFLSSIPTGWDILLIARQSALQASFEQIQVALSSLLQRAGTWNGKNGF